MKHERPLQAEYRIGPMARRKLLVLLASLAIVFGITAATAAAQDGEDSDPQIDAVALFNRGQDEHASVGGPGRCAAGGFGGAG